MNFSDAIMRGYCIKRKSWDDGTIDVYIRRDGKKFTMVVSHLMGKTEEHDYTLDIYDLIADDWEIINTKEF